MSHILNLSVHDIVDVLLRRGHLDTRIFNQASMQEGTRLHSLYQKEMGEDYISEYPLGYRFECEDFIYFVSGKADGVIIDKNNRYTVEEIKTTVDDLDNFIKDHGQWHLGQAMMYAFMLCMDKHLDAIDIQMTYIRQNNYRVRKHIKQTYSKKELEDFATDLIFRYTRYQKKIWQLKSIRDSSMKNISFPFEHVRKGQQEMMDFVKDAAEKKQDIFIQAPTGIGKTISVLYPLISLFGQSKADRILYLTSKNSIKKIAMDTLNIFQSQGAKCKSIEYTAKDNICFNDKKGHCNPEECPFARHYYDKLFDAIFDSLEAHDSFTRQVIENLCYEKVMCPYQFQLDLGNYCDVLVCDYSYVYDFRDQLALAESSAAHPRQFLCVDECHNLPERVRDMYSTELFAHELKDALSLCIGEEFQSLKSDIKDCLKEFESLSFDEEDELYQRKGIYVLKEGIPAKLLDDMDDILVDFKAILKKYTHLMTDELLEFFYQLNTFYTLAMMQNEQIESGAFLSYMRIREKKNTSIRITLLDPKKVISDCCNYFKSVCFFSATLMPKDYYIDLLGGDFDEEHQLFLPSPFPKENRKIFFNTQLSLRYQDRDETLYSVYSFIRTAVSQKTGNYFVFCPSFEYLDRIYSFFQQEPLENSNLVVQTRNMREIEREAFLQRFQVESDTTTIGLLVLGGVFSEGIDLVGDRLIGAIIISVGLPQIGFERDNMKAYYDKLYQEEQSGFHYAYSYPGINKILQAAGRVIRTESDKGFVFFIDSRFRQPLYRNIMNEIYPDSVNIVSNSQLRMQLKNFWKENEK